MSTTKNIEKEQIRHFVLLFLLITWLARAWQGLLLVQLHQAPFVNVQANNTFRFALFINNLACKSLARFIIGSAPSSSFC